MLLSSGYVWRFGVLKSVIPNVEDKKIHTMSRLRDPKIRKCQLRGTIPRTGDPLKKVPCADREASLIIRGSSEVVLAVVYT